MKKLNQFLTYFRENLFCERQKNDTEICENETKYALKLDENFSLHLKLTPKTKVI